MIENELSMADKLAMLRDAMPAGLGAGDGGLSERKSPIREYESPPAPFTSSTSLQDSPRPDPISLPSPEIQTPGTASPSYPWKVTKASGLSVDIKGGPIYSQGKFLTADNTGDPYNVPDLTVTLTDSTTNYIYVSVTRDESSRDIDSAVILNSTDRKFSSSGTEYYLVAVITTADGKVTGIEPVRTSEISVLEQLVVIDGELKLVPVSIATRNAYDLPTP